MQPDDVLGRDRHVRELANWKRRSICGDDGFRPRFHRQLAKNFFLDAQLFRCGFDHEPHIAQLHGSGRATNPGATFFCLFLCHQAALDRVAVDFFNVRQTAIDLFARDVAQDHCNATRA